MVEQFQLIRLQVWGKLLIAHVRLRKAGFQGYLTSLDNNSESLVTGEEGRKTVELFMAIYHFARDNQPVRFPLLPENSHNMDGRF